MSPYIENEDGRRSEIQDQFFLDIDQKGELNFAICDLIQCFIAQLDCKVGYDVLSDVAGVLGDIQHEFRRCVMDPYEERKRKENGDIWWINNRMSPVEVPDHHDHSDMD